MKKWTALFVTLMLAFSLAACGDKQEAQTTPSATEVAGPLELQDMLWLFDDMTGLELGAFCVQQEVTVESLPFLIGAEDFSQPFEKGLSLTPMISPNPFVLAVFRLAEDGDAEGFAKALKEKANPNLWVCVSADRVETAVHENTVLFFMCSSDMAQPLLDSFDTMFQPGFKLEEHLIDRLAGKTMEELYGELYAQYSLEQYGFMDGRDCAPLSEASGFNLSVLDASAVTDSLIDTGYFPAEEYDGERSYLLAMFRLAEGEDAEAFARAMETGVDTSGLKGEGNRYVVGWSEDVVIYFAGSGSLAWSNMNVEMTLSGTYRMKTAGVEAW